MKHASSSPWALRALTRTLGCLLAFAGTLSAQTNVLLITVDDMGWRTVGVYSPIGATLDVTPEIDQLAAEGVRFERAHVNVAVCQPSRQIMMTGKYPQNMGALGFTDIDLDVTTLGEILSDEGYWNGIFCKEHHLAPEHKYNWNHVGRTDDMAHGRNPELFYSETRAFIQQAKAEGKPFFLMANSEDPHRPFHGSTDEANQYADYLARGDFLTPSRVYTPAEMTIGNLPWLPQGGNDNAQNKIKEDLSQYYSSSRRADDSVGRLLDALDDEGVADDTLVIFMSDNGMAFPNAKWQAYHQSTKTPLIVRWPANTNITPNTVDTDHFVSNIDFMPTILDALELDHRIPDDLDGFSYLPLIEGGTQAGRDNLVTGHYEAVWYSYGANADTVSNQVRRGYTLHSSGKYVNEFNIRCVQDDQYAYLYNAWHDGLKAYNIGDGTTSNFIRSAGESNEAFAEYRDFLYYRVPEEFYDIQNDPHMLNNLINDAGMQSTIAGFRAKLETWMRDTNDFKLQTYSDFLDTALITLPERGTSPNLVVNGDFEADGGTSKDQAPASWNYIGEAEALEVRSMDGDLLLCYRDYAQDANTDDYEIETYQDISNIPEGTYTLKVSARKIGAFFEEAHLYVENHGSPTQSVVIPTSLNMQTVFIRDIKVTSGQCRIGFRVKTFGGRWPKPSVFMDDVEFFLQDDSLASLDADSPARFANWASGKGLAQSEALFFADPDGDRIVNIIEFMFDLDPNAADNGFSIGANSGNGVLTFREQADFTYKYLIEYSSNVSDWFVGFSSAGAGMDDADDSISVTNAGTDTDGTPMHEAAVDPSDPIFLRLNVPFTPPRRNQG
jgi:N-sulfoglucosamine sulfohydrolase